MEDKFTLEKYSIVEIAYAALLHDIGKFYQRTFPKSNLTEAEKDTTPISPIGQYHTHLHSGYTSRFFKEYLHRFDEFERVTSEHHKDSDGKLSMIIKKADHLASAIDRNDESCDYEEKNKRGAFITARLSSIMSEVTFGEKVTEESPVFPLSSYKQIVRPESHYQFKDIRDSADEYAKLFEEFTTQIKNRPLFTKNIDMNSYHAMYNLLNEYLVTIPASTYEGRRSSVSLYDHLKLTSAIASCLGYKECYDAAFSKDENSKVFYMLELDVSGIQSFIYKIVEGSSSKPKLTKALRGRSYFVGLVTNAISYAFLNEFSLTESNILFNTGGGAVILLPHTKDTQKKVEETALRLQHDLYDIFHNDITFVYGLVPMNCDELETFKSEKSIELKSVLGRNKMRKYAKMTSAEFFYKQAKGNNTCVMCGDEIEQGTMCTICKSIETVSQYITSENHHKYGIYYNYDDEVLPHDKDDIFIDLNFVKIQSVENPESLYTRKHYYVDGINDFGFGNMKLSANLVPKTNNNRTLNFEEIAKWGSKDDLADQFGDPKLAILKMDVDNLGGIFAFGLAKQEDLRVQRSISKYVTLSRFIEYFFTYRIIDICKKTTQQIIKDRDNIFYINYAGGDDLVIMGPAYGILYLAENIDKEFSAYTCNKNITISGGINIQKPTRPIRFGVQEAENNLEISKSGEKHAITLLNTRIPLNDYAEFLNEVEYYRDVINNDMISRSMLYSIMSNIRDCEYGRDYLRLLPRIQYVLYRSETDKNRSSLDKVKIDIVSIDSNEKLQKYILLLKLAIMLTREAGGNE